jgi:biotin transporter BioY
MMVHFLLITAGFLIGLIYQYGLQWRCKIAKQQPNSKSAGILVIASVISFTLTGCLLGWLATQHANTKHSVIIILSGFLASHAYGWWQLAKTSTNTHSS